MAYSFDQDLINAKIKEEYYSEYVSTTPLSGFMGGQPSDVIQTFDMKSGQGLSYRLSLKKDMDYENPIFDFDQAAGSEQQITIFEDEIKLGKRRFANILDGEDLVKAATPLDIYGCLRPSLISVNKRNLVKSIFDAACAPSTREKDPGLYNSAENGNGPRADRVIYAGNGGEGDYQDSIFEGVGEMGAATYEESGMSVAHIRKLKSLATNGGVNFEAEAKIMPYELRSRNGFAEERYVLFLNPNSYASLVSDPDWKNFMYRGTIQNNDQPEGLSGSRYRGMIEGVLIYECPELIRYQVSSGLKNAAWNLFAGAQAFGLCFAQRPWFSIEHRDFGSIVAMAVTEIRGQKVITFPSFQNPLVRVERGLIHSFTRV